MTPEPMRIRDVELRFGRRTYVMGIVNMTPDSFSGDGLMRSPSPALAAIDQAVGSLPERLASLAGLDQIKDTD